VIDRVQSQNCDEKVPVCHCRQCGHYSLFPFQYQAQKAFEWDGVDYYLQDSERRQRAAAQVLDRLYAAYSKVNGRKPESLVDAGCAIGLALPLAERRGLRAVGVEPESRLAKYGRGKLCVDIRHGLLKDIDFSGESFDLVYCEQVLEHIHDPAAFVSLLKNLLAPGGCLYIGVPPVFPLNRLTTFMIRKLRLPIPTSVIANIFHDPDEHISVFTRRSIRRLAADSGLHLENLPLTLPTLTIKRAMKRLLTLGSSSGNFLLSVKKQA
jgi:SAM-dependent methyltransferase